MYTLANATNGEVQRHLESLHYSPEKMLVMTCHAIAHGAYTSKGIVLVYDYVSARWTVVVRTG